MQIILLNWPYDIQHDKGIFYVSEETESTNECQLLQDDCDDNMHCIVRDDYVTRCECIDGYVRAAKQLRKCVKSK